MWLLRTLKVAAILTPLVPARFAYAICRVAGVLYFILNFRVRRSVLSNLRHVNPDSRIAERMVNAARVCITVVTNYYDLLRLRSVDRGDVSDLVDVHGLEHVERALSKGRGAIVLTAHIGNFSVMANLPAEYGFRAALISEQVDPPELFNYMTRLRSAMGIEVIPPDARSVRRVLGLLAENGLLLVAGDRDVTRRGMSVTFFGARTTLPTGPVLLAMRTGAALIPAYTHRKHYNHSEVTIWPEIELACTGDWDADVHLNLRRVARHLEAMIALDPGQWAVFQRVWPPASTFGRSEGIGSGDSFGVRSGEQEVRDFERKAG